MRVHDSQEHRKMDVTRERISRLLELGEILLSFQTVRNISHTRKTSTMSSQTSRRPQQGLACSFVGNHEELQHQRKTSVKWLLVQSF